MRKASSKFFKIIPNVIHNQGKPVNRVFGSALGPLPPSSIAETKLPQELKELAAAINGESYNNNNKPS